MKDSEILDFFTKKDERALDYLYKKFYPMITQMVINNSGSREEAQDVFQESLIVFWQKVISGKLIITSKISTYFYSVCQNQWRKELDRKKRFSREEMDGQSFQAPRENQNLDIVLKSMQQLGEPCQSLLTFYYFEQLSMSEIAQRLGFSNADTAKTKKYKCKQRLDTLIKKSYNHAYFFE